MRIEIASCAERALTSIHGCYATIKQHYVVFLFHTALVQTHTHIADRMQWTNLMNSWAHCIVLIIIIIINFYLLFGVCFCFVARAATALDHWHFIDWNMSIMSLTLFYFFLSHRVWFVFLWQEQLNEISAQMKWPIKRERWIQNFHPMTLKNGRARSIARWLARV